MRAWIIASVLALAACDASVQSGDDLEGGPQQGYTMEIRASDDAQLFVVTAPDGTQVGARAADGASALMDASGIQQFAATPEPEQVGEEVVSIRAPGVNFAISGSDEGPNSDEGSVKMSFGSGGQSVEINATDDPAGDRAHVRITGASAEDVREFIGEAEELSADTQAQMLAALNLGQ
jgi:hypothetical protein